jgi:hypothetical protein
MLYIALFILLFSIIISLYPKLRKIEQREQLLQTELTTRNDIISSQERIINKIEHENRTLWEKLKHPAETVTVYVTETIYETVTPIPDTIIVEVPPPTVAVSGVKVSATYILVEISVDDKILTYTIPRPYYGDTIIAPHPDTTNGGDNLIFYENKRFSFIFDSRVGFSIDNKLRKSPSISVGILSWNTIGLSLGVHGNLNSIGPDIFYRFSRKLNPGIGLSFGLYPNKVLTAHFSIPIIRN